MIFRHVSLKRSWYYIFIIHAKINISLKLIDDVDKEDYFDEAWENAIDDGLVDESNRLDYDIKFVDEENLEDLTNPPNQHPLPNP